MGCKQVTLPSSTTQPTSVNEVPPWDLADSMATIPTTAGHSTPSLVSPFNRIAQGTWQCLQPLHHPCPACPLDSVGGIWPGHLLSTPGPWFSPVFLLPAPPLCTKDTDPLGCDVIEGRTTVPVIEQDLGLTVPTGRALLWGGGAVGGSRGAPRGAEVRGRVFTTLLSWLFSVGIRTRRNELGELAIPPLSS